MKNCTRNKKISVLQSVRKVFRNYFNKIVNGNIVANRNSGK